MKSSFSISWLSSTQPRKQRKFRFNAPLHIKGKFLRARLSKELSKKHATRNVRVRKGDKVRLMRGQFKGTTGTVDAVDLARERIYVSGVALVKKDGGKVPYPIHPSNVQIIELAEDKRRFKKTTGEKK
jgi:large subunit ribosomal protein L24